MLNPDRSRWATVLRGTLIAAAFALIASSGRLAAAPPVDVEAITRYFEELRARRLHIVAERYALDRLIRAEEQSIEQSAVAVELSRTYAAHATMAEGPEEAESLWRRADGVLGPILSLAAPPRRAALEFQRVQVAADRAQWLRWLANGDPDDEPARLAAGTALADAIRKFSDWSAGIDRRRRDAAGRPRTPLEPGEATPREINDMLRTSEIRQALLSIALAEIAVGTERAAAVVTASERLNTVRKSTIPAEWEPTLLLARIRVARLSGDDAEFDAGVRLAKQKPLPADVRAAVLAEEARRLLTSRRFREAARLLADEKPAQGPIPDELRALNVEAMLGAWSTAEPGVRERLWDLATAERDKTGGIWGIRAAALVESADETRRYGDRAAPEARRGRSRYLAGDLKGAAAHYAAAVELAREAEHSEAVVPLAMTLASIHIEAGDDVAAVKAARQAAAAADNPADAAQASLLEAWCLGRLASASGSAADQDRHRLALESHLQKHPDDPTAADVAWLLSEDLDRRDESAAAIDVLLRIPNGHPRRSAAVARIAALYEAGIADDAGWRSELPATDWRTGAAARLEAFWNELPLPAAKWSPDEASFAASYGRVLLRIGDANQSRADAALAGVLAAADAAERSSDGPVDERWQVLVARTRALRIVSLAAQDRFPEAAALLDVVMREDSAELLDLVQALDRVAAGLGDEGRDRIGQLQLAAVRRLEEGRGELSAEERRALDRSRAAALLATDKAVEAAQAYERLLDEDPSNAELISALAGAVELRGRPEDFAQARVWWQKLERGQSAGSREWLQTRLRIARSLANEGRGPEAAKLIAVTRLLYPELGGPQLRQEYETLERSLEAASERPSSK
ncbi:MAG: hypothetical protein KF774_00695 [Planctomyces sp.]|nr:hypothetical protein [Planctomyces sp.]